MLLCMLGWIYLFVYQFRQPKLLENLEYETHIVVILKRTLKTAMTHHLVKVIENSVGGLLLDKFCENIDLLHV